MVTIRPMKWPMNMMNMPRMPPGVASFNLASQANTAGGMHPGGIPMQRGPGMPPHQQQESHEDAVISSMEIVMSLVLEESEEVNPDLISLLLDCMKKDNQKQKWSPSRLEDVDPSSVEALFDPLAPEEELRV
ncbi:hypothetical protein Syun_025918 [Stephania yunnanensis]|uniref:Uncharacterized protein n=1 Tax=Stephania yunnanensis TaxID=152371 RepID=A0AAP0EZN4_9MAGN